MSKFQDFIIKQVPREDDTKVDALANLGFAFMIHHDIKISVSYVIMPIIENIEEEATHVQDLGSKDLNPKECWTRPIFQYLHDGSILENEA